MSLWLVRAGRHGEHEPKFFNDNRIYLTWGGALQHVDLSTTKDYDAVKRLVFTAYADESKNKLQNWTGQISAFALAMKLGDWVVVPRKSKAAIAFGEITGEYTYTPKAEPQYVHWRTVKWLNTDVPRSAFDQDLLYSFGAFMTVCEIKRNDAEKRVRALAQAGWISASLPPATPKPVAEDTEAPEDAIDLEQLARDQIAKLIERRFKGHEMARLVEAILRAQGYTTFKSPPGPDKGIDILAAPGPLGFGKPRICVQVKSQDSPIDSPTLHQLVGAMQSVQADQGLLVAWGGWKSSVDRELPNQFFRVRMWDQDDLIEQLLEQFERLPEDLRAELPLKRIWTVATQDEEE